MRGLVVLFFVVACRSPEKGAAPSPAASVAPVVSLAASASATPSARASAAYVPPPPIAPRDAGQKPPVRGDDTLARRRAMLEGLPEPKKLAIDEATASADRKLADALTAGSVGTDIGDAGAGHSHSMNLGGLRSLSDFERDP